MDPRLLLYTKSQSCIIINTFVVVTWPLSAALPRWLRQRHPHILEQLSGQMLLGQGECSSGGPDKALSVQY